MLDAKISNEIQHGPPSQALDRILLRVLLHQMFLWWTMAHVIRYFVFRYVVSVLQM